MNAARLFFEDNFRPLVVQSPGKFTGYFEPELRAAIADLPRAFPSIAE